MTMPSQTSMIKAIANKDSGFDGTFYYGVLTTGVFCKPSCPSKAALIENLSFYSDVSAALQAGFRPCKRCNPSGNEASKKLEATARYIETHFEEKISLAQLAQLAELSASHLQRVFKQCFGISPKQYQDALRMRHFKQQLKNGKTVSDAIYDAGFGSISRIYGETSRNIGMSPLSYRAGAKGEEIHYACRMTALGIMLMAATKKGVCCVLFDDNESQLTDALKDEFPKAELIRSAAEQTPELDQWMNALTQHLQSSSPRPDIPLDIRGTAFQIKVWHFLTSIKEGELVSYAQVAQQINKPKAVRAVGSACGKNNISILIPCHRVLRSDGGLGGYRWGLERKRKLLEQESNAKT